MVMKKLIGIVLALAMVLGTAMPAMAIGVPSLTPSSVEVTIPAGGNVVIQKTVQTPNIPPFADIMFLADSTGSMGDAIASVQASIGSIMATVLASDPTAAFGAATYRDEGDAYIYQLTQPITTNTAKVSAAVASWSALNGGDIEEAQLNALYNLGTDPATAWRPPYTSQNRFIVWFGDNPGHDPSVGHSLAQVIGVLTTGTFATIHVYAIPVNTPDNQGLDFTGQATAIAIATGGAVIPTANPGDVAAAILTALTNLSVTVSMTSNAIAPISTTFSPVSQLVTSGSIVNFTETISVASNATAGTYTAKDWALINGAPMTDVNGAIIYENKTIHITGSVPGTGTTSVTVASGGGNIPAVKAKWEQDTTASLEDGDVSHAIPGSQFNPPMVKNGLKMLQYFAVVTDVEEGGNVAQVFVDVFHPAGVPAPYSTSTDPRGGLFKYEIPFAKLGHSANETAMVIAANNAHLIKFGNYTMADVIFEMEKGTADLWFGQKEIDYEQPAGDYDVNAYAIDHNSNTSLVLHNTFLYVPTAGVEVDFTGINYGSVSLGVEKMIPGDTVWNTPIGMAPSPNPATVRNIGNTWAHVTIKESDLGLGKDGTGMWNVRFDARMGNDDENEVYFDPEETVTLPNYLPLSSQDELDLSIKVIKGFSGATYSGTITIGATIEPFALDLEE
jgi:hypothetical protein